MLFVGVVAHKSTSQLTVVDGGGQILKRQRICTSPAGFAEALGSFEDPLKAVLEASYSWGPTFDWLDDVCDQVVLAHPGKVRVIAESRIKTDKIDSEILAHLLRADLIPTAYAPSKEIRALKRVLRQRMFIVRTRVSVKNRIRALLTAFGGSRTEDPVLPDRNDVAVASSAARIGRRPSQGELTGRRLPGLSRQGNGQAHSKTQQGRRTRWLASEPTRRGTVHLRVGSLGSGQHREVPKRQALRELHRPRAIDLFLGQPNRAWSLDEARKSLAAMGVR